MNPSQLRKTTAPLTPNLEDYKQKNKSKSRRKQNLLQPTNPPTPKIYKGQINLKPTNDKMGDIMQSKQDLMFCPLHPQKIATHYIKDSTNRKFCKKCYCLNKQSQEYDPQIQQQKRRELQQFKKKIMGFGLKLQQAQKYNRDCFLKSQQNFFAQKQYIKKSFQNLKNLIQQKQKQMTNILIQSQNQIKAMHSKNDDEIQTIKKSLDRYLVDIDSNYHEIIQSLSYDQFNQIIDRYNDKLNYFEETIENGANQISLSSYIPRKEIQKCIEKSSVDIYPILISEDTIVQQKTLQRYPTQKKNILIDHTINNKGHQFYSQQHNESMHNKMNHARQSRDRYEYSNQHMVHQKHHTNKQNNFNMDNSMYH